MITREEIIFAYECGNRDFSSLDLRRIDLSCVNLTGANLTGAYTIVNGSRKYFTEDEIINMTKSKL